MNRIKKFVKDHEQLLVFIAVDATIALAYGVGKRNGLNANRIAKAEKYSHEDGRQCIKLTFRNGAHQDIIWKDAA